PTAVLPAANPAPARRFAPARSAPPPPRGPARCRPQSKESAVPSVASRPFLFAFGLILPRLSGLCNPGAPYLAHHTWRTILAATNILCYTKAKQTIEPARTKRRFS